MVNPSLSCLHLFQKFEHKGSTQTFITLKRYLKLSQTNSINLTRIRYVPRRQAHRYCEDVTLQLQPIYQIRMCDGPRNRLQGQ